MKYNTLLSQSNFMVVNKKIAKKIGLINAIVISNLCSLEDKYGNGFYFTQEELAETCCVCLDTIKKSISYLKKNNFIIIEKRGLPCKNYYFFTTEFENFITNLLEEQSANKIDDNNSNKLVEISTNKEVENNTNIINNNINNKDNNIIPPTPPKGEESDKKDPSKKINKEARKIFEEHFNDIFSENYYWTAKDAGSMSKLLGKLKYSRKQKNLPVDDDSVLYALKYFLSQINEGWIFENFSVTNINSKFNEIISQIYSSNGKNKNFSKQRANEAALQQLLSAKEKIGVVDEATKPF